MYNLLGFQPSEYHPAYFAIIVDEQHLCIDGASSPAADIPHQKIQISI